MFIGGLTHHMRYQGYLEAMNHHGLQPWSTDAFSLRAEPTQANGYQLMQQLLDMPSPPTAVICYNDLMAFRAALAKGLFCQGRYFVDW
ncbi:substrate-binding domain-containing protein [Escherichia coli]